MGIDLTGGLDADREYVFAECPDIPEMREAVNMWVSDDRGVLGLPRFAVEAVAPQWDTHDLQVNIAFPDGRVAIADTYNHKVKVLDPQTGQVKTLAGNGKPGHIDGHGRRAQFYEPGGLSVIGEKIFVGDTNNHCIRVVDSRSGNTQTLALGARR